MSLLLLPFRRHVFFACCVADRFGVAFAVVAFAADYCATVVVVVAVLVIVSVSVRIVVIVTGA